jgi:hypothetical protein
MSQSPFAIDAGNSMTRSTRAPAAAAATLCLIASAFGEATKPDPAAAFPATIEASRMVLTIEDGHAGGAAAAFLRNAAEASQFFLIGEEHGVASIADTIRTLLPALHAAGYRHFAVETDPYAARLVEQRLREGGTQALATFLHEDGRATTLPFFNWASEAALAEAFLAGAGTDPSGNLWGLDQVFIGAYGLLLERVAAEASDPAARELAATLAAQAKGNLEFLGQTDATQFDELRRSLSAAGDTELVDLVDGMIVSRRIYAPFIGQPGLSAYAANRMREDLMKTHFLERYRAAGRPKVLFKFGSNHMVRGLSPTHVPSLGNFVADFAFVEGKQAFNLLVLCGPGTQAGDFMGNVATCELDVAKLMPEVAAALDAAHPTLFDLSTWKDQPRQWRHLPSEVRELLWAYDALLVVPGGRPAEPL